MPQQITAFTCYCHGKLFTDLGDATECEARSQAKAIRDQRAREVDQRKAERNAALLDEWLATQHSVASLAREHHIGSEAIQNRLGAAIYARFRIWHRSKFNSQLRAELKRMARKADQSKPTAATE
jgi:hypothetical protein